MPIVIDLTMRRVAESTPEREGTEANASVLFTAQSMQDAQERVESFIKDVYPGLEVVK